MILLRDIKDIVFDNAEIRLYFMPIKYYISMPIKYVSVPRSNQ